MHKNANLWRRDVDVLWPGGVAMPLALHAARGVTVKRRLVPELRAVVKAGLHL